MGPHHKPYDSARSTNAIKSRNFHEEDDEEENPHPNQRQHNNTQPSEPRAHAVIHLNIGTDFSIVKPPTFLPLSHSPSQQKLRPPAACNISARHPFAGVSFSKKSVRAVRALAFSFPPPPNEERDSVRVKTRRERCSI